jgi:hypothetical protein
MNDIHVINLSQYTQPKIVESKRNEWVEYGEHNKYYDFLIDCYQNSTTNNACINNISRLIYGNGLSAKDAGRKPNEYAQMKMLFGKNMLRSVIMDLKMLGNCAFQLIYTKDRKKIAKVEHIPMNLLRPEKCDEKGKINAYYYSDNWEDIKRYAPTRIPTMGTSTESIEVLVLGHYSVGQKYFSFVDYLGALDYCVAEEEIALYLINEIKNSFSGTKVINFNGLVPTEEQQKEITGKVMAKLTGSTGQKVIVSFNNNKDLATTVEDISLTDAPEHYSWLATEARDKILNGHNVTSSMLIGINQGGQGFSSNADEIKVASAYFYNTTIKPFQELIIDGLDQILAFNGISLDLYFERLTIIDPTETTVNMSADVDLTDEVGDSILEELQGESMGDEWEVVDKREYKDTNCSIDEWIQEHEPKKSMLTKLADYITSFPSRDSNLDKSVYKVRYEYSARYNKDKTRRFCSNMMSRTANGVVYRLEDIDKASRAGVNKQLGHKGQPYDLFKFKGGVNCGHYWSEVLYKLKTKKDGKGYVEDKALSSSEEVASIPKSYKPRPYGTAESKIAPIDMPNNGHHPNYGK